jgi:hypothetical protein
MKKIDRGTFLKQSLQAGAFLLAGSYPLSLLAKMPAAKSQITNAADLLQRFVTANDAQVEKLLQADLNRPSFGRKIGSDLALLSASYCTPSSRYYHNTALVSPMEQLTQRL